MFGSVPLQTTAPRFLQYSCTPTRLDSPAVRSVAYPQAEGLERTNRPMSLSNPLETAYDRGTFGVSRRTFVKMAAAAGVTAVGGALVFPQARQARAAFTEPAGDSWPALDGGGKVRFTVHSDTHVGAGAENNYVDKISHAFSCIYSMAPGIDAHFFVGDSADTGAPKQYDELAELLNTNAKAPVGIVMGNHEYYNWEGDGEAAQAEFSEFLGSKLAVEDAFQVPDGPNEGELDCDFTVGGYHVLALSAHPGGYDNSWYGDRQDWIREHLAAAVAENPEKPVFLFTHHPFGNTVWYSVGGSWNGQFGLDETDDTGDDMAFYEELATTYPQLIHFSGHTHIPMADPRSIYQDDGFTLIQTATFANNFWMSGDGFDEAGDEGGHPDAGQDANQCELVEIDTATNEVTVYRLDFREGAVIGEPWTIVPSEGAAGFKYTHPAMEEASQPPVVAADAAVTCDGKSFTLSADKVAADTGAFANDVVVSYRVEVAATDDPETPVFDVLYMSDYYKAAVNRDAKFTRPLFGADLEAGTGYILSAYAVNAFGKEALVGRTEFTA